MQSFVFLIIWKCCWPVILLLFNFYLANCKLYLRSHAIGKIAAESSPFERSLLNWINNLLHKHLCSRVLIAAKLNQQLGSQARAHMFCMYFNLRYTCIRTYVPSFECRVFGLLQPQNKLINVSSTQFLLLKKIAKKFRKNWLGKIYSKTFRLY